MSHWSKLPKQSAIDAFNAALIGGARSRRIDIVEKALDLGAEVNFADSFGMTALHLAANSNDIRMIQLLIRYGAMTIGNDRGGLSPFFSAVINGRIDAMDLLGGHCLDLEQVRESDRGMLEMALLAEHNEAAIWLIDHGSDIDLRDWHGDSLLVRMIESGRSKAAEILAKSGAYIDEKAIEASQQAGSLDLFNLLKLLQQGIKNRSALASSSGKVERNLKAVLLTDEDCIDAEAPAQSVLISESEPLNWSEKVRAGTFSKIARTRCEIYKAASASGQSIKTFAGWLLGSNAWYLAKNTEKLHLLLETCQIDRALDLLRQRSPDIDVNKRNADGLTVLQLLVHAAERSCPPSKGDQFDGTLQGSELTVMQIAHAIDGMGLRREQIHARFSQSGNSVLHELIQGRGHSRLCMHLLSLQIFKEMVNLSNQSLSRPLHLSVQRQDPHLMSALVEAGACLNAFDRNGNTPLHMAAYMLDQSCAETAISLGSNIHLSTRSGVALDQILDRRKGQSDCLKSMVQARRTIESAKSIFSSNNPMARMVRANRGKPTAD